MNAREVLSKHSGEPVNELDKCHSIQIIRPEDALEAMEDFASQKTKDMFTKEQVEELMFRTSEACEYQTLESCAGGKSFDFYQWLEQENPFGSIQKDENKLLGSYNSGDKFEL